MAYTWTDGELITAEKLNNTGGGDVGGAFIVNLTITEYSAEDYVITADKSFSEVQAAIENGMLVYARGNWGNQCYSLYGYNFTNSGSKSITFSALSPQTTYCDFDRYTMTEDGSIRDSNLSLKLA